MFGLALQAPARAAAPELADLQQDSFKLDPSVALTPSEAAAAVVKGWLSLQEGASEAVMNGINGSRFQAMVDTTGNPPGPMDLVAMWRRGIIDAGRLDQGVREGYVRNEWLDVYHAMRYLPISVADAVNAAVQGHMDYGAAEKVADELGIAAGDFRILFETAGNPPGPMQLLSLWNRGYITEAQAVQGLRESRLKDAWIPAFLNLRVTRPNARLLLTLVQHGAIDKATAVRLLQEEGYAAPEAEAIAAAGVKQQTTAHKDLTIAEVRSLYTDHIIDRATAKADLQKVGLDPTAADELLDLAEQLIVQKFRNTAISKVHTLYLNHRVEKAQASTDLDGLGVPSDQRDRLLTLWDLEREANYRPLTEAQIIQAGKKNHLTPDEVAARLGQMGYHPEDARLLMLDAGIIST